jgi:hypothetical protein
LRTKKKIRKIKKGPSVFPNEKTDGLLWTVGPSFYPRGENMRTEFHFLPGPQILYGKVHCILRYGLADFCREKKIYPPIQGSLETPFYLSHSY